MICSADDRIRKRHLHFLRRSDEPRVARDQRYRRIRVRHYLGCEHATVSWPFDGRDQTAARTHYDALEDRRNGYDRRRGIRAIRESISRRGLTARLPISQLVSPRSVSDLDLLAWQSRYRKTYLHGERPKRHDRPVFRPFKNAFQETSHLVDRSADAVFRRLSSTPASDR